LLFGSATTGRIATYLATAGAWAVASGIILVIEAMRLRALSRTPVTETPPEDRA
jgi:hypothetical protein